MINCAIYPRKSKQVDNSDSMDAQIYMCQQYLDQKYGQGNYTTTIYDKDYGITGHSIKARKDFQRMMQDIKDGKTNLVVIQRYDRIARNTRDFCNLYHDMEQAGCNLVSVSQQIDTTTPYGKKFMYDQASMAELEWALNSERRKDAIKYAASIGKCTLPNHSIPFGYMAQYVDGIRRMVKNPEQSEAVMDIFDCYRKYYNYTRCAKEVNEKYGFHFTTNTIKRIINNPIFKGEYKGNPNFCEPYIRPNEWDSIKEKKPVIRYDLQKKEEVLFTGLIYCPSCNRKMRACSKKKRNGERFRYYHCEYHSTRVCDMKKVKAEHLIEAQLLDIIDRHMQEYSVKINEDSTKKKKKVDNSQKIEHEIERLNMMFQKGRITEEYYDSEYLRLEQERALNKAHNASEEHIQALSEVFCDDWREMYESLDKLGRKLFWRDTIERIIVDKDINVTDVVFL